MTEYSNVNSGISGITTEADNLNNVIFTHLKLCLATAIHDSKWVKIAHICLIWDQTVNFFYVKAALWDDINFRF